MSEGFLYIVLAAILAFDLMIVKWKFSRRRYADAILDIMCLVILNSVLGGSLGGEIIGTVAALFISIYLIFFPPKLTLSFPRRRGYY